MNSGGQLLIGFCLLCVLFIASVRADGSEYENNNNDYTNDNSDGQWIKLYDTNGSDGKEGSDSQTDHSQQNAFENEPLVVDSYKNNKKTYKNRSYQKPTLAKVIPQQQEPNRLDEIYTGKALQSPTDYNSNSSKEEARQQVLLYLRFPNDFNKANPRNGSSLFKWYPQSSLVGSEAADNAAVQAVGGYKNNEYGGKQLAYGQGYLKLTSIPYSNDFYQEGFVGTKQNFAISNNERILGRMKLSCKTIDADKGPFNSTEVSRCDDDPRMAGCHFQMNNINATTPLFYFIVINKSVWAAYVGATFVSKRKVGIRERYDSIVDAGLELDKRQEMVNYYLNGYKVWSIGAIGAPAPDDGITNTDLGSVGTPTLVNITQVGFAFGTGKCLDESDPYTSDQTRLVRILPADSPFYSPSSTFYDSEGVRSNVAWGQGAILKAYKLLIMKASSKQLRQSEALPGVYGSNKN